LIRLLLTHRSHLVTSISYQSLSRFTFLRPSSSFPFLSRCRGRHRNPPHCGRVGGPACGNHFKSIFIHTFDLSPYHVTSFVCIVNRDPPCNSTLVPPHSRPVQGKRLEAASTHLVPSSLESRQWASSHQQRHFFTILARTRHPSFSDVFTLFTSRFRTLRLGNIFLIHIPDFTSRLPDHRPNTRTYVPGIPLFHSGDHRRGRSS
jgi:hypothetical protein